MTRKFNHDPGYWEILIDRGFNNFAVDRAWDEITHQLLTQKKANNTEAELIGATSACGKFLQDQVSSTHDQDELPNHLVILY